MNKFFKTLRLMAAVAFLATACLPVVEVAKAAPIVYPAKAAPAEAGYQAVLGKPLSDETVADFLTSNDCTQAGPYHLCRPAGVAFWSNKDQIVETAFLYVNESEGFSAYQGELPFGLAADDTMADVEQKLGYPRYFHSYPGAWEPGLPSEGRSPDHTHYWAIYKRFGVTVIYNTPAASDKNATLYAILVGR